MPTMANLSGAPISHPLKQGISPIEKLSVLVDFSVNKELSRNISHYITKSAFCQDLANFAFICLRGYNISIKDAGIKMFLCFNVSVFNDNMTDEKWLETKAKVVHIWSLTQVFGCGINKLAKTAHPVFARKPGGLLV